MERNHSGYSQEAAAAPDKRPGTVAMARTVRETQLAHRALPQSEREELAAHVDREAQRVATSLMARASGIVSGV